MNEIDIKEFLRTYKNKEIIYIPNAGNAGDTLIVYGTLQVFDELKLNYIIGDYHTNYKNKLLFYAGGGNLVGIYDNCSQWLIRNKDNNEIVILPHTIKDEDELIKSFGDNIKVICREKVSYNYVYELMNNKSNVMISDDMAFHITNLEKIKGEGILNCYREDIESTNIDIPEDNIDLSTALNKKGNTDDRQIITEVTESIFDYISKYEVINTNRLHMAIASSLLDKEVNFYPNSYYKNQAVYDYSIKSRFPKTTFFYNIEHFKIIRKNNIIKYIIIILILWFFKNNLKK